MTTPIPPIALALALAVLVAGCAERRDPAPVVFRGSAPATAPAPSTARPKFATTASGLAPDARGVVDYGGYSAVVARQGDTIDSIAARVGLSASALAAYNGLPAQHVPKAGDELILPPMPAGTAAAAVQSTTLAPIGAPAGAAPQSTAFDLDKIEKAIDTPAAAAPAAAPPPAAAAPAAAPRPGVAATPPPAPQAVPATAAPTRTAVARATPAIPATPAARFIAPVDGKVIRPFSRTSAGGRNDGIDYAAPAGAPVRAVAAGQIALVSESLGGLGTIVLIRHENDLLTVYGRVDGVTVQRGARVSQGEVIGTVAPGQAGEDASLHFEVRRGAESVDPGDFLAG